MGMMNTVKGTMSMGLLHFKKHSPEILVTAGVVGVVVGTVMACKATASDRWLSAMCDFSETKDNIEKAKAAAVISPTRVVDGIEQPRYTKEDEMADKAWLYKRTAIEMLKIYGPSVATMGISIIFILSGFRIVKSRNAALAAAYKIIDSSFKAYRSRVRNELGEGMENHFMYNTKMDTTTETRVDKNGEEIKVVKFHPERQIINGADVSGFARIYEEGTTDQWVTNPDYNWMFIRKKKDWLTDQLHINKHLFLNEVYDELGFPRTPEGSYIGWVINADHPDTYLDFGPWHEPTDAFTRENNKCLLDFNPTGPIWNLI